MSLSTYAASLSSAPAIDRTVLTTALSELATVRSVAQGRLDAAQLAQALEADPQRAAEISRMAQTLGALVRLIGAAYDGAAQSIVATNQLAGVETDLVARVAALDARPA
jgi:HAMP domain-containing protein